MATRSESETHFALSELAELREEVLRLVVYLMFLVALVLLAELALEFAPNPPTGPVLVAIAALVGGSLITLGLLRWGPTSAAAALTTALVLLCLGESALSGTILPFFVLPLATFIAGVSLGVRGSLGSLGLTIIGSLLLTSRGAVPYGMRDALVPIFFVAVAAALGLISALPVQIAVLWAFRNYSRMSDLTDQLRLRQAELVDALKSLDLAYGQLERTSRELARARTAAEAAQRHKAEFATNISHELRTPLNLIIGFSDMLLSASPVDDEAVLLPRNFSGDVEAIHRNAEHLSALIDDVLDLGEIEAGRVGLRKEWMPLYEVVDEATSITSALIEDRSLTLSVDVDQNLPPICMDRTRVRQILINLLNNAVRHTEHGGISISAKQSEHDIVVSVRDTGIGIRTQDLPHVFEEFRRFNEEVRQFGSGYRWQRRRTGLGLAICRTFVELHGGNIWVDSSVGQGTTFYFTLPLTANVASSPMRRPWETWARLPIAPDNDVAPVLVVSSDPGATRLFQRHLDGYRILNAVGLTGAPNGQTASAVIRVLAEHEPIEAALTEGQALATRSPVFVCRMPSERDLREELGVYDYLIKPFARDRLSEAVRRVPLAIDTVLVVDDEPEMVELIARTITSAIPCRILRAHDGSSALDVLRRPDAIVDLLILDLLMPSPDGFSVLETVRKDPRLASIPVIVVSGRGFGDRVSGSGMLAVTRADGLSIRDLMLCTQSLLAALPPT